MSGHSKWATIKHKKALLDAKRGKVFTKLLKEITVVARDGGGDPATNPRLRTLVEKAKQVNMPHDNLQRAIKKGTGELPGLVYEAHQYEGYGPGGIAIIVDTLTDNKNRTVGELRHIFSRYGGRLGETGSVNWMFSHAAVVHVPVGDIDEERLIEVLIDYSVGAITKDEENGVWIIEADAKALDKIRHELQAHGCTVAHAELEWVAHTKTVLSGDDEAKALPLLEALDEIDDVQNVYSTL